jgi:hypothetical protein
MKKITLIIVLLFLGQLTKAQDTCLSALPITAAGTFAVTAVNGTEVPSPICADNGIGATAGEWYAYTPTADHTVTVTSDLSVNNGKDTRVHVYTGTCGAFTCYAGDDDAGIIGTGYLSVTTFNVVAGTTYYIAWDNRWSSNGFTFQLIEGAVVIPPATPISYVNQSLSSVNSEYNTCVVDMNGDHKDDIVGVSGHNLRINYQAAIPGTFYTGDFPISGTSKMPDWSIAAGDYNKDGYNDLLLGSSNGLTFWKSNSNGTAYTAVTPGEYIFCQRTNFVDINNDGNLDAFSCHDVAPNVYYINDASGNFTYHQSGTSGAYSLGITGTGGNYASLWTDLDNDGDLDMFISKCSGPPCEIHRNDGNGVFTDISVQAGINFQPVESWSSAIADFDNDGDMDIIIGSNGSVGTKFFRNNLDTSNSVEEAYTNITVGSGWETNNTNNRDYIAYDFDNDGFVDVMGGGNRIMFNNGDSTFTSYSYPGVNLGAVGDLNNDGFLDFLNGSTIRYAVPNANKWLTVALQGIQSNRNGLGARVEIYGSWGKQVRDIRSGEGFEFMSTLNAHFGIGAATNITKVVIKWPSGTVDEILNPEPNQALFVVEGSSPALGVNNNSQSQFTVYPNPASMVLNITNPAGSESKSAEIYDLNGRMVLSTKVSDQKIGIQKLVTGTYILLLEDNQGSKSTQKFLKN